MMARHTRRLAALSLLVAAVILATRPWLPAPASAGTRLILTGVNISGAEFGRGKLPGVHGRDYIYPDASTIETFADLGMNTVRLPFRWERLQREPFGPLDTAELKRLERVADTATGRGMHLVLDVHNYARHQDRVVGGPAVPIDALADLWSRLAARFGGNERVVFGLMNEPMRMETEVWLAAANRAIAAIRNAGARNLILVPGNAWSGAHSWFADWYGTPNADVMAGVQDPGDNFAFEIHQYLDENSSGKSPDCVSPEDSVRRVAAVTGWLRSGGYRGFLGEFGTGPSKRCLAALDAMLGFLAANADAWLGWAYWSAGPWWGDYPFSIQPEAGRHPDVGAAPQLKVLLRHLAPRGTPSPHRG